GRRARSRLRERLLQRVARLLLVELEQLAERRGVLWPLVGIAEADHAWESQGVARRVIGRLGDLVRQHFEHDFGLDPYAGRDGRADPCRAVLRLVWRRTLAYLAPLLIAQPGADPGDRHELIGFLVVDTDQQRSHAQLGALSAPQEVPQHDTVDGVF